MVRDQGMKLSARDEDQIEEMRVEMEAYVEELKDQMDDSMGDCEASLNEEISIGDQTKQPRILEIKNNNLRSLRSA